jgi:drug/metabolite transporter (DMT)-like permease
MPMSRAAATAVGFSAVLIWSFFSVLTVASGPIPPFELAALTFAIGGALGAVRWLARDGAMAALRQPPAIWALGLLGLFGTHALYFTALRLAPPAEAQLLHYLWPLAVVLLSALLLGERLRAHHLIGALAGLPERSCCSPTAAGSRLRANTSRDFRRRCSRP